jgi:hypothetical protein
MKDDPISPTDVQLTRWLDSLPGAVPPESLDAQEAERLRAEAESMAALLRRHVPTSVEPPYPEFFNSQLLKKLRDERSGQRADTVQGGVGFWAALQSLVRSPWWGAATAGAAAIAVLAMAVLRPADGGNAATGTRVLSVFSPEPNATAHVATPSKLGAVIITVEGLEDYPADRVVAGLNDNHTGPLIASHLP